MLKPAMSSRDGEPVMPTAAAAAIEAADVVAKPPMLDEAAEVMEITAEAADAHDEAMLELVALEMAAPDVSEIDDAADPDPRRNRTPSSRSSPSRSSSRGRPSRIAAPAAGACDASQRCSLRFEDR